MAEVRLAAAGRRLVVVGVALSLWATAACGGQGAGAWSAVGDAPGRASGPAVTVMPADQATNVSTALDVQVRTDGDVKSVALTSADGTVVAARPAAGGTWVPASQLASATRYTLAVTAAKGGASRTVSSSFTTMARPQATTGADLYVSDGDTVGVGLPVVVEFSRTIAADRRAAVERRLFVTSDPPVVGVWHWFSDSEVHYRPKEYWPSGAKVAVRLAVGGMDLGFGRYGKRDRTARFTVGPAVVSKILNAEKRMDVYRDGVLLRSFPISLGKPKTPTPSGTLVVMERKATAMFDSSTYGVPVDSPDGYRQKVAWNTWVTWGGIFVHAAPWSVADQGRRNVSHGCVNAAPANARWFYDLSTRGDVVQIIGTERPVAKGDGWTDWSMTWEQYQAGSALH